MLIYMNKKEVLLLGEVIVYNIFTTNYMFKVFICSNLNLQLKFNFLPININS